MILHFPLDKKIDAVFLVHSRHKNETRSPGDPRGHAGYDRNVLFLQHKIGVHFLIKRQKLLSENQLTAPLQKLYTQLSTKIVDNFLQRDYRMHRLSRAYCCLSLNLPRLAMRFKVARFFNCLGVALVTHHRSGRVADLAVDPVLDRYPWHHR